MCMAAGGHKFVFVGGGINDIRYPQSKNMATKGFITDMDSMRGLLSHI